MNDIVERLRKPTSFLTIEEGTRMHREAATEIEHLRAYARRLEAEIKRLRAALATCRKLRSLDADEIDRLRAALKDTTP